MKLKKASGRNILKNVFFFTMSTLYNNVIYVHYWNFKTRKKD